MSGAGRVAAAAGRASRSRLVRGSLDAAIRRVAGVPGVLGGGVVCGVDAADKRPAAPHPREVGQRPAGVLIVESATVMAVLDHECALPVAVRVDDLESREALVDVLGEPGAADVVSR